MATQLALVESPTLGDLLRASLSPRATWALAWREARNSTPEALQYCTRRFAELVGQAEALLHFRRDRDWRDPVLHFAESYRRRVNDYFEIRRLYAPRPLTCRRDPITENWSECDSSTVCKCKAVGK